MTAAERARRYRERQGAGTVPGRPATQPCGTAAAYRRHLRHGEPVCQPCRDAYNAYNARYYHARKARQ